MWRNASVLNLGKVVPFSVHSFHVLAIAGQFDLDNDINMRDYTIAIDQTVLDRSRRIESID